LDVECQTVAGDFMVDDEWFKYMVNFVSLYDLCHFGSLVTPYWKTLFECWWRIDV
jgi:hypothetical protein